MGFFISAKIFAKFDDFSMYIVPINDDKFIQIIKTSNLEKIWSEMKKPTLETYTENLAWTLEFLHKQGRRNSIISGETPQKNTWIKKFFHRFPPKFL